MNDLNPFIEQASERAKQVDTLFVGLSIVAVAIAVLAFAAMIFAAWRYKRGAGERATVSGIAGFPMQLAVAIGPLLLGIALIAISGGFFFDRQRAASASVEVRVIGKQWLWKFQHSNGRKEINELHIPMGKPVRLLMTSQDDTHDLFIPAFRLKQDVLPGQFTTEVMLPNKLGEFNFFCSKYCGTLHAGMRGTVYVMEQSAYEAWLEGKGKSEAPAVAGEKLFNSLGCMACHANIKLAPPLANVYMSDVKLSTGATVLADAAYLRESLLDPNAKIVDGYQPAMPSFRGRISEEELTQLMAYIKSLKQ